MELFTIGHSNLNLESFIALLHQHDVTAIADVRSYPYSRHLPYFSQAPLKAALQNAGIHYVFLGRELGARPSDASCYVEGKALYERIAATPLFEQGIQRVLKGSKAHRIALMCAEKDPITCHRAILVCQNLRKFDLDIKHILRHGGLETHQHLESRLLSLHGLSQPEPSLGQLALFTDEASSEPNTHYRSLEELLKEAYEKQGSQIAYVEKREQHYESAS
jgi:uncharacterized protein (DUF488 family)